MDGGVNLKYKRSFIFFKDTSSTAELLSVAQPDIVSKLRLVVKDDIQITHTKWEHKEQFSFWFSDFDQYEWFTENLYIKGPLKDIFKGMMIYAKQNQFGFCLPSVCIDNITATERNAVWYVNNKPDNVKPYDATAGQKRALDILTGIMSHPNVMYSVTLFDYQHNFKYTENAFTTVVSVKGIQHYHDILSENFFPEYAAEKKEYNDYNSIQEIFGHVEGEVNTSTFSIQSVDTSVTKDVFDLRLDLTI